MEAFLTTSLMLRTLMMSSQCPRSPVTLTSEKVALTDALELPLSRALVGYSQSSDYFSEASSPDSLSRSISSSNVSELGIEDDLTELEDAEMLSSFRSTRGE